MKLSSVRIRHYKSLDDVAFDFDSRVTLLVGPNAVGKSNLVDCLRFLRDAVSADIEHAISARGGIGRVRQYSKTKPYKLGIHAAFQQELSESKYDAEYDVAIESLTASNYAIDHERMSYFEEDRTTGGVVSRVVTRDRLGQVSGLEDQQRLKLLADQLALGHPRTYLYGGWPLARFIQDWQFSSIYPNRLRDPSTPDKDSKLAEDGRNWASIIKALRRTVRGRQSLERIADAMRVVLPAFDDVTVSSVGSYLVPSFRFKQTGKDSASFDPVQLSDGTLRIFGILLALYQSPRPQLLVIEEPEQTVHPGVLAVLAEAFLEVSETTQIVLTTHSPHLVDFFRPEQIRVVTLHKGLTKVGRVKRSQVEAVKRRLMSMQEFMLAEGIQAE